MAEWRTALLFLSRLVREKRGTGREEREIFGFGRSSATSYRRCYSRDSKRKKPNARPSNARCIVKHSPASTSSPFQLTLTTYWSVPLSLLGTPSQYSTSTSTACYHRSLPCLNKVPLSNFTATDIRCVRIILSTPSQQSRIAGRFLSTSSPMLTATAFPRTVLWELSGKDSNFKIIY